MYLLIQVYRTFGYFIVLPCTVMYRVTGNQGIAVSEIRVNDGMYLYVLDRTSSYWYMLLHTYRWMCVLVHTSIYCNSVTYKNIPVHTSTYQYIPACTCTYYFILFNGFVQVHTSTYRYISVHTWPDQGSKKMQTGFEPVIVCILFACITTALRGYRHQVPDI